jgi:hypothetical protein
MLKWSKKKKGPKVERRRKERRKPGDRRFAGRLIGLKKAADRVKERRKVERRKSRS